MNLLAEGVLKITLLSVEGDVGDHDGVHLVWKHENKKNQNQTNDFQIFILR
jgi:hypothetical protein